LIFDPSPFSQSERFHFLIFSFYSRSHGNRSLEFPHPRGLAFFFFFFFSDLLLDVREDFYPKSPFQFETVLKFNHSSVRRVLCFLAFFFTLQLLKERPPLRFFPEAFTPALLTPPFSFLGILEIKTVPLVNMLSF